MATLGNPDIVGQFLRGRQAKQQNQTFQQQQEQARLRGEQAQQTQETQRLSGEILSGNDTESNLKTLFKTNPGAAEGVLKSLGLVDQRQRDQAANFAFDLRNTNPTMRAGKINARIQALQAEGRDSKDTEELLGLSPEQQDQALQTVEQASLSVKERTANQRRNTPKQAIKPSGVVEFESLTKNLTEDQKKEATLIKLGLSPRAVGSAIQTITAAGVEELVGDASAVIKQREKFGELTGSSRAKSIDSGFDKIGKINAGIGNIDRAISVLNSGAGVGAIQKFLPSIRASSVELDNIQKSMALDVIGSVTFGALSQGELNLAKEVALPTGLSTKELVGHLNRRKAAQEKLRGYYEEQIQFLDQGGSVAGFLRSKDRDSGQALEQPAQDVQAAPASTPAPAPTQQDRGVIMIDASGNRARVFPDGTFEELQ